MSVSEAEVSQLGTTAEQVIDIGREPQQLPALEKRALVKQLDDAEEIGEGLADQQVDADASQDRVQGHALVAHDVGQNRGRGESHDDDLK